MVNTGYQPGNAPGSGLGATGPEGMGHDRLKKDYSAYLDGKSAEIAEQKDSRRYYHTSQWTAKQVKALNARKQPVVTYNHEAKKINSVVGLLARQKRDPKAYPRTQQQGEGAEIATACIRYVMDQQHWEDKDSTCALFGAVDGISGVELQLEQGDTRQPDDFDIGFDEVDPSSFFYDPRSMKRDFADARFMGTGKWADEDAAIEMFPDKEEEIKASLESGSELTSNPDSDGKWTTGQGTARRIRIIDHWYLLKGEWRYCVYTGSTVLAEGVSPFVDEKGKTICKYIMFSANVDQDGDRYGFHRNMKSSQDEINQRRSKALHIANTRRIIVEDGQGLDVEKIRSEAAKPDGVILYPPQTTPPVFDDAAKAAELTAHLGLLQEAKLELESGNFNPEAVGNSESALSGRAIQLRQQAGIAELGPFIVGYKGWKLRLYRAIWNAIRVHWKAERAIRVTDNNNAPALIPINQLGTDPRTGLPAIINHVNALDVDIILEEGPDAINMQAEAYDTMAAMGKSGVPIPPEVIIALSSLDDSKKKEVLTILEKSRQQQSQPQPGQQQAIVLELQGKQATNSKTQAETAKLVAETQQIGTESTIERQGQIIDLAARQDDRVFQQQDHEHDQQMAGLDLIGKHLDIARAAQPPAQ